MLEGITKALTDSFKVISGNAKITEANIGSVINEIRVALLDADVSVDVVKEFINKYNMKAIFLEGKKLKDIGSALIL